MLDGNSLLVDGDEDTSFRDGFLRVYENGFFVDAANETDAAVPATTEPSGLSPGERRRYHELVRLEREISSQRRRLHDRIDFIRSQGVNAQTDSHLLHLIEKERAVSQERKRLHRLIDST